MAAAADEASSTHFFFISLYFEEELLFVVNFGLFTIILHFLSQITNLGAKFFGLGHHQLSVLSSND